MRVPSRDRIARRGARLALLVLGLAATGVARPGRGDDAGPRDGARTVGPRDAGRPDVSPVDAHPAADAATVAGAPSARPHAPARTATIARPSAPPPDAGEPAAKPPLSTLEPPPAPLALLTGHAAQVDGVSTPVVFYVQVGGVDARKRAALASAAFAAALESPPVPNALDAETELIDGVLVVKVHGRAVASLTLGDAIAAGATSMPTFAEELETRLIEFVERWKQRHSIQRIAFRLFFSIFLLVLAALTLRGLGRALERADAAIESRGGSFRPLVVFDIPLLSSDAVRGLLGTLLVMARVLGAVGVVLATIAAIMVQFERTRPLLQALVSAAAKPIVSGLGAIVAAIPGLLFAVLLVVFLRAGLRFAKLLLDGVSAGRVKSPLVPPSRAPVVRELLAPVIVILALPLIVAAAFGRFGTPFEAIALGLAGAALIAVVPVVASACVGATVMWRGLLRPGDWIEVGEAKGELTQLKLTELVLVPAGGGSIVIPMLLLALRPLHHLPRGPDLEHLVRVDRTQKGDELLARLDQLAKGVDPAGVAELLDADGESMLVRLRVPIGRADEGALVRAVLRAADEGLLRLSARDRGKTPAA